MLEIDGLKKLRRIIFSEVSGYYHEMMGGNFVGVLKVFLTNDPIIKIVRWQVNSRFADYYIWKAKKHIWARLPQWFFIMRRNTLASKIGIEINSMLIDEGFLLYHISGTVINGSTKIGKNCHLHGNNCLGNSGPNNLKCPTLGDNVRLGVGAKVIGGVYVANDITIAAGAVVTKSFYERGITIGGIPAKKIK